MSEAGRVVLDSYAVLAYLEGEEGAAEVEAILHAAEAGDLESWMSILNVGEVLYITEREQGLHAAQRAVAILDQLPIRLVDADRQLTFEAAHVKAHRPISYADAFAVALAARLDAAVVTGDPEFERVRDLVEVRWVGLRDPR